MAFPGATQCYHLQRSALDLGQNRWMWLTPNNQQNHGVWSCSPRRFGTWLHDPIWQLHSFQMGWFNHYKFICFIHFCISYHVQYASYMAWFDSDARSFMTLCDIKEGSDTSFSGSMAHDITNCYIYIYDTLDQTNYTGLFTANPNPPADCGLGGLPIASAWGIAD